MGVGDEVTLSQPGYSGTPLAKKLGIKPGFLVNLVNAPDNYLDLFTDFPKNVSFVAGDTQQIDLVHFFTKQKDEYFKILLQLKGQIKTNGIIWVSWPKKSSKIITDITEDIIMVYGIKTGLVDIKICAVDDIWSGLKFVIPLKDR